MEVQSGERSEGEARRTNNEPDPGRWCTTRERGSTSHGDKPKNNDPFNMKWKMPKLDVGSESDSGTDFGLVRWRV